MILLLDNCNDCLNLYILFLSMVYKGKILFLFLVLLNLQYVHVIILLENILILMALTQYLFRMFF